MTKQSLVNFCFSVCYGVMNVRFFVEIEHWKVVTCVTPAALLIHFYSSLSRRHLMVLVVRALVFAHQEFQACQEALDPRDQQVLQDHPELMVLKDPLAREESRVMKVPVEDKALRAPRALKDPQV